MEQLLMIGDDTLPNVANSWSMAIKLEASSAMVVTAVKIRVKLIFSREERIRVEGRMV